ncbi:MAG: C10 family peptidase [Bacteroidales bacterium]
MKTKSLFFTCLIVILFCFHHGFAKKVDITVAKQIAVNFYIEHSKYNLSAKSIVVTNSFAETENSIIMYYVFNLSNGGFVIVAAEDGVHPILGYSYEGIYTEENQSPEFIFWMNKYKQQIAYIVSSKQSSTAQIDADWARYSVSSDKFIPSSGTGNVAPLTYSLWDQGCCYNSHCPIDSTATTECDHVVTGCVATSMAQIMFYYRYPLQGEGSHSYNDPSYGIQSASFSATTYDWNAMSLSCIGVNDAIATLMYHCGVSDDMQYGPTGSMGNMMYATNALTSYFKYSLSSIRHAIKSSFIDAQWADTLENELNNNRPFIYGGFDTTYGEGHAWVCDGYQATNYFHFNWGWSGNDNGYFYLDALDPSGYNFTSDEEAIYGIYPRSGYPYYCSNTTITLTSPAGTIDDGSGPSDYKNNNDCSWLIAPTGAGHINISFNNFSTADSGDVLTIYNGSNDLAPVLKSCTGTALPTPISSTSPTVFLKFITNGSDTSSGWQISYTTTYPVYCSGVTPLTAASDTFSDGSGSNNYNNNINCKWMIQPPGAGSVTLHFLSFNTEPANDIVKVVDPVSSTVLGTFSGTTIPSEVTSHSGQMLVEFTTNATITAPGWSAVYTSSQLGVENYNIVKELSVFPNPANNYLHISFYITGRKDAKLQLLNITGQVVYDDNIKGNSAAILNKTIDVSGLSKGIYSLQIITLGEAINKKVVIE